VPGHFKEALPMLHAALKNRLVRLQAVDVLGKAGPEAKEAVPALLGALQDESTDAAYANRIGSALGQIVGPEIVGELEGAFAGAAKKSRPRIAQALTQTGRAGAAALLKWVEDEDPIIRQIAVSGLGRSADSVPALIKALRDKDPKTRQEAA